MTILFFLTFNNCRSIILVIVTLSLPEEHCDSCNIYPLVILLSVERYFSMNSDKTKTIAFLNLLRAFAVVLITHAHTEGVWPVDIHGGKALGNALFFMISGFLLHVNHDSRFLTWYSQKLIRLYVPLTLVQIFLIFIHPERINSVLKWIGVEHYWFVPAIALLYIFMYFILKYRADKIPRYIWGAIVCYFLLYIYYYATSDSFDADGHFLLRTTLGMIEISMGAWLRVRLDGRRLIKHPLCKGILACLCYGIAMIGGKLQINVFYLGQFLQHTSAIAFAVCMMDWGRQNEDKIRHFLEDTKTGRLVIQRISALSLEIYLVQLPLMADFKKLVFPINLIIIILLIGVCAVILQKLSRNILHRR